MVITESKQLKLITNYFSKTTLLFAVWIVISASFTKQVFDILKSNFSDQIIIVAIWIIAGIFICFYIMKNIYILKDIKKLKIWRILVFIFIFIILGLYINNLHIIQERMHIIYFTLLGFLAFKDLSLRIEKIYIQIIFALVFCFFYNNVRRNISVFFTL